MAEAAGLVLGVFSIAGLFSTYIEYWDIIVTARVPARIASSKSSSDVPSGSSSIRLVNDVAETVLGQQTLASKSAGNGKSFVTASAGRLTIRNSLPSLDIRIPGAYPDSVESRSLISSAERLRENVALQLLMKPNEKGKRREIRASHRMEGSCGIFLGKQNHKNHCTFAAGDANYGQYLVAIKQEDEAFWRESSGFLIVHAESRSSAAKRMFLEIRDIRASKISFINAAPLGDSLEKALACIEGPSETPYEGGIFWITAQLPRDPRYPPLLKFQTKIYHANISPQGHICADYQQRWNSAQIDSSKNVWYQRKKGEVTWSLGALLVALCGLLAVPDVDDPMVPEIAQTYLKENDAYCQVAKLYTQRYALKLRPEDSSLDFLDDTDISGAPAYSPPQPASKREDTLSIQLSLNSTGNEPRSDQRRSADYRSEDSALVASLREASESGVAIHALSVGIR